MKQRAKVLGFPDQGKIHRELIRIFPKGKFVVAWMDDEGAVDTLVGGFEEHKDMAWTLKVLDMVAERQFLSCFEGHEEADEDE